MLKATIQSTAPDQINVTVTATMTLGEWKDLRKQLTAMNHPAYRFNRLISEMITKYETGILETLELEP